LIADVRSHLLEEPEHLREAMVADRWASHPGPAAQLWRACWRAAADSNVSCPVAVEVEGRGRCLDMVDAEDEEDRRRKRRNEEEEEEVDEDEDEDEVHQTVDVRRSPRRLKVHSPLAPAVPLNQNSTLQCFDS
jgi:hypothetical protein